MLYKDFKESEFTYIVMHQTGVGVMECPTQDVKVVFETDNLEEAQEISKKFYNDYATPDELQSSWVYNHFPIMVNTATEKGKKLLKEFSDDFKVKWTEAMDKLVGFSTYTLDNGTTVMIQRNELYDGPTKL